MVSPAFSHAAYAARRAIGSAELVMSPTPLSALTAIADATIRFEHVSTTMPISAFMPCTRCTL